MCMAPSVVAPCAISMALIVRIVCTYHIGSYCTILHMRILTVTIDYCFCYIHVWQMHKVDQQVQLCLVY